MIFRDDPRPFLRKLFEAAVAAADPMRVIPPALPPRPEGRVVVVGAGKASARMAEAVESVWGPCEGLVITRDGYERPCKGIEIVSASHPVPDARGEVATRRMLALLEGLREGDLALALISGGGSALLVAPAGDITLDEKRAINQALLSSGAPIGAMNRLRKHLSRVKGGQLAAAAYPARMLALAISDVPGDDPGTSPPGRPWPKAVRQTTPVPSSHAGTSICRPPRRLFSMARLVRSNPETSDWLGPKPESLRRHPSRWTRRHGSRPMPGARCRSLVTLLKEKPATLRLNMPRSR